MSLIHTNFAAVKIIDDAGIAQGIKTTSSELCVSARPFTTCIAEGHVANTRSWSKMGYKDALTTEQTIGPAYTGLYVWPTVKKEMTIVSASNSDNGALGQLKTMTLNAGGAGYTVGDILTVVQAGGALGTIKVLTLGGSNAVATFEIQACGTGYTVANGLATTYGGAGTNCVVNITAVSGVASTGALTVTVYYLDDGYLEKSVTVTMNGDTPVKIAADMFRVQNARVATVGTNLSPVAAITIAAGGVTYGYISLGKTRMRQCLWTVPFGHVLFVTQIAFSCSGQAATKSARFTTRANYDSLLGGISQRGLFFPYNEVGLNNSAYWRELNPPTKLVATTDLKVDAVSADSCTATCSLSGWLENA